jgi:hypothetical protein
VTVRDVSRAQPMAAGQHEQGGNELDREGGDQQHKHEADPVLAQPVEHGAPDTARADDDGAQEPSLSRCRFRTNRGRDDHSAMLRRLRDATAPPTRRALPWHHWVPFRPVSGET